MTQAAAPASRSSVGSPGLRSSTSRQAAQENTWQGPGGKAAAQQHPPYTKPALPSSRLRPLLGPAPPTERRGTHSTSPPLRLLSRAGSPGFPQCPARGGHDNKTPEFPRWSSGCVLAPYCVRRPGLRRAISRRPERWRCSGECGAC